MASVLFSNVDKVYDGGTHAVVDLTLEIADGEFLVLVGPSGCGKTTALRMVAGLEDITSGSITIGDQVVNKVEPRLRNIAMVFQSYALYPNMTVYDNMAFGLKMRRTARAAIRKRVTEIAEILELTDLLDRKPSALSGGQRQRVAMGRAIVRDPSVFLLDEPLSNLDAKLRVQMRAEISRIQRELSTTALYVTHDQIEAMTMGTKVAVMRKGILQQVSPPRELYAHPVNLFVASFIGSPPMNLIKARLEQRGDDRWVCVIGDQPVEIPTTVVHDHAGLASYKDRTIGLGIRPEYLSHALSPSVPGQDSHLVGRVAAAEVLGPELLVHVSIDAAPVVTAEVREVAADIDLAALKDLELSAERGAVMIARLSPSASVQVGDPITLRVDTHGLHFFNLETEKALTVSG